MKLRLALILLCVTPFARAEGAGSPPKEPDRGQARSGNAPDWFEAAPSAARPIGRADGTPPPQALVFRAFAPRVTVSWDDTYLYIQDNGLPSHPMMVGITAWQQQLPLPQPYFGENAWRIPLHPVPAKASQSIHNRFLRGAIAIAVNGIPIFNPQNNRGEISKEIGELDNWGGHSGRADDYHYHVVPVFLQAVVGPGQPIAYALDGYPIYGPTEPDGSVPKDLDECHGHTTPGIGYHYHASSSYPYVIGGFHGEVIERNGQVDPQPRAQPVRPSLTQMKGATITSFDRSPDDRTFAVRYSRYGSTGGVDYSTTGNGVWHFRFLSPTGGTTEATYPASPGNGAPRADDRQAQREPRGGNAEPYRPGGEPPPGFSPPNTGKMKLWSPVVSRDGTLPIEYTGDGAGISPPLEWNGAPAQTQAFALVMHHLDPQGQIKWYWTVYNIPATTHSLPKAATGVGVVGSNSVNSQPGYAPPHSKGPGKKTYTLTIYALSTPVTMPLGPSKVTRTVLLTAIQKSVIDSAVLSVTYDRTGLVDADGPGDKPPRRPRQAGNDPDRPSP